MLTGAILGAIIVILLFLVAFLQGKCNVLNGQVAALNRAQAELEGQLQKAVATLQEAQKPYIVNFTDEGYLKIAERIWSKTKLLIDAYNEASLKKLN